MRLAQASLWSALCLGALLHAGQVLAAVDVNLAREADLDGVKGIGPALSARILAERAKGRFQDWRDLIVRVKGIGPAAAVRLSEQGLTVDGAGYAPHGAPPAAEPKRP
ncbi:MAG: helix-hairpin-helix domain-containing protein [Proteobacteria bacterium]|nr:helix-hairpin-helix domain-containing protein [Pseudomonadota bacterium]